MHSIMRSRGLVIYESPKKGLPKRPKKWPFYLEIAEVVQLLDWIGNIAESQILKDDLTLTAYLRARLAFWPNNRSLTFDPPL